MRITCIFAFFFVALNVSFLAAGSRSLSAGGYHFVAASSGRVIGLGDNTYGQLSSGGGTVGGLDSVGQVAAGGYSTIILKLDGTVWYFGEMTLQHTTPHGTPNPIFDPIKIPSLSNIDEIAAGHRHYLALDYDGGKLYAWGHNGSGQIGNGSLLDVNTPVEILDNVKTMAAGDGFSIAVKNDNTVWSWGCNCHGQLGLGDTAGRLAPEQVVGVADASAVAAGGCHSLVLLSSGQVLSAGGNQFGQLGSGSTSWSAVFQIVSSLNYIKKISAGYYHSAAVDFLGQGHLWGRNFEGQCTGGATSPTSYAVPRHVIAEAWCLDIVCGYHFTLFKLSNDTLWACGSNSDGQIDGVSSADQDISPKVLSLQKVPVIIDDTYPGVYAGRDIVSWSGQEVQLHPLVVNNSKPPVDLVFEWTADPADAAVFIPDALVENPKVTITTPTDNPTVITMFLAVNNKGSGRDDVVDTMRIFLYDDSCKAAAVTGRSDSYQMDFNKDCIIDLQDLSILSQTWLNDISLKQPVTKPALN